MSGISGAQHSLVVRHRLQQLRRQRRLAHALRGCCTCMARFKLRAESACRDGGCLMRGWGSRLDLVDPD